MLKTRIMFVLCSALAAFSAQAAPETFCVKLDGSGGCFTTIQAAVNAADNDGDTIKIAAGTYFEAVAVPAGKDGLTLAGSSAKNTLIDTGNLADNGLDIDAPNVSVIGLGVRNSVDAVAIQVDAANFKLLKSEVVNADDGDCVDVNGSFAIIEGNRFFACGDSAMDIAGSFALISKNKIVSMDDGGMYLSGDNIVVKGNSCELIEDDACIEFASGSDEALVEKNRVIQAEGIVDFDTAQNPRVLNNQIIQVGDNAVEFACVTDCSTALVEGNRASGGTDDGGLFNLDFAAAGGIVRKNTALKVMDGGFVISGASTALVENNTVTGSDAENEDCFDVEDAGAKTLRGNKATGCSGSGFDVSGTGAHVLEKNTARGNAENGFELRSTTTGTQMISNTATGNSEEGIQNEGTGNVFNKNTAKGNRFGSDFCESGAGTVLGAGVDANKFASTSTDCVD